MKFCNSCGHRMDDDDVFCPECGSPTQPAPLQPAPPQPAQGSTSSVPLPNGQGESPFNASAATTANTAVATAAQVHAKKTLIIIIASIVAVALVATGIGFGTYKAQLWGGKTVPNPADLGIAKSNKTHEFTAADVEASLHKRGFKTITKQTFSAKPQGSFLNYRGIDPGKRYGTNNNPVTIIASLGPGIPKGTSGQPAQNVTASLESMGVPVHYRKVIVSDKGPKEGTVVASYPTDGQAVTDTNAGINVGVAEHGEDGIGYDIVGLEKNQAQQQYAGKGFNVIMMPRFSSKKMLGKIVDSDPKPGTPANGGNLVLFYGIDASGMDDAAIDRADYTSSGVPPTLFATNAPVGGKYCTNSGKCITFNEKVDVSGGRGYTTVTSSEISDQYSFLAFCHSGGDPGCPTGSQYGERGELYYKHLGAFELMDSTAMNAITCGTDSVGRSAGDERCVNGQVVQLDGSGDTSMSGATYNMGPLYAYFPVNAKIKNVVDSGYFDKDYVAEAGKQKPVYTSRPFLISRDKSLYKTTSVNVPDLKTPNPFIPESLKKDNGTLVPMKPAPSDQTAYYLIEDPLDWNSLPEFTIEKNGGNSGNKSDKSDAGNSSKADAQPQVTPQNATPDQITAAAEKGDDSLIAGKYCTNDGHCLDLSKTGQLTGGAQESMLGIDSTQLTLSTASEGATSARNVKPDSQFLEFRGSVNDYLCKNGTSGQACKNSYHTTPEVDRWPAHILYVFKGSDTSSWYAPNATPPVQGFTPNYSDRYDRTPAKTDRAYIYPVGWHMTVSPFDDGAYYFQG